LSSIARHLILKFIDLIKVIDNEAPMPKRLNVLMVEDNERDAALLLRELRRGGYEPVSERVETREDLRAALERRSWDIVLSDYSMPRFGAPEALSIVRENGHELPFIIISGTIGEEAAVESMRAGAHDFMPKGALARLLPAIEREMREVAVRLQRKKMQEQLLMSERMASVGILAASVAHEINNPLAVLAANLEIIAQSLVGIAAAGATAAQGALGAGDADAGQFAEKLAVVNETLRDAQEAAERVRLIVRDLKIFSHPGDAEKSGPVAIEHVLESSIRMASNEIRHRARLVRDYTEVPPVEANEARLGQVFLNLIVNAAQAIPDGRAADNEIRISTRLGEAGRVIIEISDTGIGMPPDALSHIFDAFFTTKPVGVGTGLGLAICHRIVTSLGGDISVHSQPGAGTTFRVSLPLAQGAPAQTIEAEAEKPGSRRGHILVVDDEPMLGTVIQRILGQDHEVIVVTSAIQALRLIDEGQRFDIVLCDLMMPEMTGMDLHKELLRTSADQAQKMIFMTGGTFTDAARDFLDSVPNQTVEKPFRSAALRQIVQGKMR
jgi:signal transduction histidine kinase